MDKIIEVNKLKKSYGKVQAVKDISFYVEKAKLFAFLGPNGAGKSTTIDILCSFLKPDSGKVLIDGELLGNDDIAIRNKIGVVFQDNMLDGLLSIEENLIIRGKFYGLKGNELKDKINEIVDLLNIADLMKRPYGKLSGGQRRKCDIARALLNTPKILFLDEPTTGLDPQSRKNIWEIVNKIQYEHGVTIFLTTHYMEEADAADYVIIIDEGLIVAKGSPAQLKNQYSTDYLKLSSKDLSHITPIIEALGYKYTIIADTLVISLNSSLLALEILNKCEGKIDSFQMINGNMDDVFIAITGKELKQ